VTRQTQLEYSNSTLTRKYELQVVQFTLARILQGFQVTPEEGATVDMEEGSGIALPKVKPLRVALEPRLPLHLYENL